MILNELKQFHEWFLSDDISAQEHWREWANTAAWKLQSGEAVPNDCLRYIDKYFLGKIFSDNNLADKAFINFLSDDRYGIRHYYIW